MCSHKILTLMRELKTTEASSGRALLLIPPCTTVAALLV